jgi:hypothetical protein
MDEEHAITQAREFLCQRIDIIPCQELPDKANLYEFNPAIEYLFIFKLFGHDSLGASEYIAVDRENGKVRYLGFHGD